MAEFPGSIPTNRTSSTSEYLSNMASGFGHVALHNFEVGEIIALATKLGTGSSTASSGTVLRGTGSGTSAWGQIDLPSELASFTSAQLAAKLSDETGSGAAVFGTAPSISNPTITGGGSWAGSPILTTPAIASLTNAQHNHENAAGGGQLDGDALTSGSITPEKLLAGTGTAWGMSSYSPTLNNVTLGTGGSVTGRYIQMAKFVWFQVKLVLGTGGSFSGVAEVSLPATANSTFQANANEIGFGLLADTGTTSYQAFVELSTTTAFTLVVLLRPATYIERTSVAATVPFTWGNTDLFTVQGFYEAA